MHQGGAATVRIGVMPARPTGSGRGGGSRTRNALRYEPEPGTARTAAMSCDGVDVTWP